MSNISRLTSLAAAGAAGGRTYEIAATSVVQATAPRTVNQLLSFEDGAIEYVDNFSPEIYNGRINFSPDGTFLAYSSSQGLWVYDTSTEFSATQAAFYNAQVRPPQGQAFSSNNLRLSYATQTAFSSIGQFRLMNFNGSNSLSRFADAELGQVQQGWCTAINPAGTRVAFGYAGNGFGAVGVTSWSSSMAFGTAYSPPQSVAVTDVKFKPSDDTKIGIMSSSTVTYQENFTILSRSGNNLARVGGYNYSGANTYSNSAFGSQFCWTPDGNHVVFIVNGTTLAILDVSNTASISLVGTFTNPVIQTTIRCIDISSDGKYVLLGLSDSTGQNTRAGIAVFDYNSNNTLSLNATYTELTQFYDAKFKPFTP